MNKVYILPRETDAYGFVKQIAAKKYNIDVSALEIERGEHGKPYFKNLSDFYFNISHSGELLAIAISDSEVGIDIEKLRSPDFRIIKRFCEQENRYITEKDSELRFFEIWTKKEAFLKYKGTGLSGGLGFNSFECTPKIKTFKLKGYLISVCGENIFEIATQI